MMRHKLGLSTDDILFVTLLGAVTTILGYQFGLGNQTEHIPLVLRALDPAYLRNDFFVEIGTNFGPRYYYVHLLAFFAHVLPLPHVVLGLAFAVNSALVGLTYLATRDLLDGDRFAGYTAAILVVTISSFPLGLVTDIRFTDFQSASLAIPGCLAAIWAGLRGRAILAALLASVSSLAHPLYGVETGSIALGTALVVLLFEKSLRPSRAEIVSALIRFFAAVCILIGATLVFWGLPQIGKSGAAPTTSEIINTLAHFRAPHHYIPSQFPAAHFVSLVFFLLAFTAAWWSWRKSQADRIKGFKFLVPFVAVILGCFAGYLLIEVWPTRVGMIAQPFRMLYLVKWLGFIFLGWLFATWIHSPRPHSVFGWIALLGSGAVQPIIAFMGISAEYVDKRMHETLPRLIRSLGLLALLSLTLILVERAGKIEETVKIVIAMGIALPLARPKPKLMRRLGPILLAVSVVAIALGNRSTQALEWRAINPIIDWSDHRDDDADTARWALVHAPETAVFLIPPEMGSFRLLARRAVVVDFESFPFEGSAMLEWRKRIVDSYGEVRTGGFEARREMGQNYRQISDETLEDISTKYDASFVVLYVETETARPVLYTNNTYKVVSLNFPPVQSE